MIERLMVTATMAFVGAFLAEIFIPGTNYPATAHASLATVLCFAFGMLTGRYKKPEPTERDRALEEARREVEDIARGAGL